MRWILAIITGSSYGLVAYLQHLFFGSEAGGDGLVMGVLALSSMIASAWLTWATITQFTTFKKENQ